MRPNGSDSIDKVAIITGATGGIGEATAKLFLDLGAKVMLVGRSADKIASTKGRLEAHGEVGKDEVVLMREAAAARRDPRREPGARAPG